MAQNQALRTTASPAPVTPLDAVALASEAVAQARRAGADLADALYVHHVSLAAGWRLGKIEEAERAEAGDLGLRIFARAPSGALRQAVVSTTDFKRAALAEAVERALAMARAAPEDPYCGLADPALLARDWPDLDLEDPVEPEIGDLLARARAAEEAALAVPGVTNSEGGSAHWGRSTVALATSEGFAGSYGATGHSLSCSVLAGEGTAMERDYDFARARFAADLPDAAAIGRRAGERTIARLRPRKVRTVRAPVIYDPRVANGLLGHLAGAITGPAIARGTSFLKTKMGERLFAPGIEILDDPHRRRGLGSKPFDGEGVVNRRTAVIEGGRLVSWLLDTASARQLGLVTTGHAARGTGGPPSPSTTNLFMAPSQTTPEDLIADIREGLYVTELMGMGVNPTTGDYSRGAAGFWIENGRISYPVSEITVAGNLLDMFARCTPANDLEFRYATNAPSLRIEGMTIAGA